MTKQQLFDKVAKHLLTQNAVSIDPHTQECQYRGPDGLKCAIGALIPDKKYDPALEGSVIDDSPEVCRAAGLRRSQFDLARKLQWVHDQVHINRWGERLTEIAQEFRLSDAVVRRRRRSR